MPPDPPRGSGLWPSIIQCTGLLTRQCPSTSKVNENPVLCIVLDVVNSYQTFSYHAPNEFPNNYKISLYLFMITPVHH